MENKTKTKTKAECEYQHTLERIKALLWLALSRDTWPGPGQRPGLLWPGQPE